MVSEEPSPTEILTHVYKYTHSHIRTPFPGTWNFPEMYIMFSYKICGRNTHATQWGMWSRIQRDRGSFRAMARSLHPQVRTSERFSAIPKPVSGYSCIRKSVMASGSRTPLCLPQKVTETKDGYYRIRVCERWAVERFQNGRWVLLPLISHLPERSHDS